MVKRGTLLTALFILLFFFSTGSIQLNAQDKGRFDKEIQAFRQQDAERNPDEGLLLFVGSSTIRMWQDLEKDFPDQKVLNRGFGGSHFDDVLVYFDELILPYHPSVIFIYEGDNDIAAGKTTSQILTDAKTLVSKIRENKPEAIIAIISAKPSLARWELQDQYVQLNRMLTSFAGENEGINFIDTWSPMLMEDGTPKKDIFITDGLHMNRSGYEIWKNVVAYYLQSISK